MNKIKFLIGLVFTSMVLAACSKDDNPIDTSNANIDDPQETVTDQPATARDR